MPEEETHRYGIIDPLTSEVRRYQVKNFVEKPAQGTAPSNLAILGRYVFTPEIFMYLEEQQIGAGGEIQLTDAIQKLNEIQRVLLTILRAKGMMLVKNWVLLPLH